MTLSNALESIKPWVRVILKKKIQRLRETREKKSITEGETEILKEHQKKGRFSERKEWKFKFWEKKICSWVKNWNFAWENSNVERGKRKKLDFE